ncbi:NAD-dependent epimerase/dehydratase family protein [Nocardioides sp.]|uniref:NAD-dependent epimerase/dehydratase family protein n=1 Tax=Nocardioides sp. TaxID=35761 RepID=UPI00261356E4|nr:NAD-dependent epimerase/dehydratase family protein [Nocardioides sp.]
MSKHVVVGAGPVGQATARELVSQGHEEVLLVSRSGSGSEIEGVARVALDVTDATALGRLAEGASALYNCINPPSYDVWTTYWPPIAASFLAAAERSGAVLATASCLYAYGPVDEPMVEGMPDAAPGVKGRLRGQMWAEAKQAHDEGRIRAVEVRGSDYMGVGVTNAHIPIVAAKALSGKSVRVFGSADEPHTFTDVRDMARALVTVASTPSAHGRVWHAPSNPPVTQTQAVADVCRAAGREPGAVRVWPSAMLSVGGLFMGFLKELRETVYQFQRPYVMDSSAIERELGLAPTPWDEVCRATAEHAAQAMRSPAAGSTSTHTGLRAGGAVEV